MIIEILAWIALALSIISVILIIKKKVYAWLLFLIGDILWTIVFVVNWYTQSVFARVLYFILDFWGLYEWRKESRNNRKRLEGIHGTEMKGENKTSTDTGSNCEGCGNCNKVERRSKNS